MDFQIESKIVGEPQLQVTLTLPPERARELASVLDAKIVWYDTNVHYELEALYDALMGETVVV